MAWKIRTPKFTVPRELFDKAIPTFSGRLLWYEKIAEPMAWEGRLWVITTMMLSHAGSWAHLYEAVPLEDWVGDVFVFGCYDEEWIAERQRSGVFWRGVRVQVDGGHEYVLGAKVHWDRVKQPRPPELGQPG